jgi:arsenate reductase (glutaredoxin)
LTPRIVAASDSRAMAKNSTARFLEYAACSTCRKAKRWLDDHGVTYEAIPIVEHPPSAVELEDLIAKSKLPIERWFNTSGQSYRELLARIGKEKFAGLSTKQKIALLAGDGKMIKRPVFVQGNRVLVGFDESRYQEI